MSQIPRAALLTLLVMLLALPALAQRVRLGLKGGVPISKYFETGPRFASATRRYTLGPSIEVNVWNNFSLEFDAMYKRVGYAGTSILVPRPFGGRIYTSIFNVTGSSWDFPLMMKYRFGESSGPYLAGGGVVRHIGPLRARGTEFTEDLIADTITPRPIDTPDPPDLRKRTWPGLAIAGGFEFGRGRFRVLPEFRYTRLTSNTTERLVKLRLNQNQAEFLLGFLF